VQLDVDALRARTKRPERIAAFDGAAEARTRVIRKTRENALTTRRDLPPALSKQC